MKIGDDYWLVGVERMPLAAGRVMDVRRFLVEHITEGWQDSYEVMKSRGVSVHFAVKRDGRIIQHVPCNRVAFHAGESSWVDPNTGIEYKMLNGCSLGIEIENVGTSGGATYPSTMGDLKGTPIKRVAAKHKHGGPIKAWEVMPPAQIQAVKELSKCLCDRFNLDDVIGHEDASPGRKTDPGPMCPMQEIREFCGFTGLPVRR